MNSTMLVSPRSTPGAQAVYEFGEYRLDSNAKVLLRQTEPVRLPLKATEILLVLVEQVGEVVPKDQIMNAVWPDRTVDEANLKQNIAVIRKALDIAPGLPGHIDTFVGRGYRILGPVRHYRKDESPHVVTPSTEPVRSSRPLWLRVAVPLALLVIVLAVVQYLRDPENATATIHTGTVAHVTPYTRLPGAALQPAISPEGASVAFLWQQKDGKAPGIYVKSSNSEDPVRVGVREGRHASPAWSPDGQEIAYLDIGIEKTELMLAHRNGSGERVLASFPQPSYTFRARLLDWSPDGKLLCLAYAEDPKAGSTL